MATIADLEAIDAIAGTDLVVAYDASNEDARKALLSALDTYLSTALPFSSKRVVQVADVTGNEQTVQVQETDADVWVICQFAADYATFTLKLPATPVDNQEVAVQFQGGEPQGTFNLDGNGATVFYATGILPFQGQVTKWRYRQSDFTWYGNRAKP